MIEDFIKRMENLIEGVREGSIVITQWEYNMTDSWELRRPRDVSGTISWTQVESG